MTIFEEYRFCLDIVKKSKSEFSAFDVISLLDVYFNRLSFYPSISKDLDLFSQYLGIKKVSRNYPLEYNIYMEHYSLWFFL